MLVSLAACSDDKKSDGTPPEDAAVTPDAAVPDSSVADTSVPDANVEDAADAATCGIDTPVQSDACTKCLRASCCSETMACLGSAKCKALDECVNQCLATNGGDAGTVATCAQRCNSNADADVRVTWRAYNDCLNLKCVRNGAGPCQ